MVSAMNVYKLCLIVLSIQIIGANAELSDIFPKIKLLFSDSKVVVSDFVSKLNVTLPSFDFLYSAYSENIQNVIATVDKLVSNLYSNVNILMRKPEFLTLFKINSSMWNWTIGSHDYPCSEFNATAFEFLIKHELFGQHIVDWSVSNLLKDHLSTDKSKKPLVMSFHGPAGCGKSFVSKMIADSLFQEGFKSKFVHVYYGSLDFPHEKDKQKYRKRLLYDIPFFSHLCDRSVFIFDEVDKMVPGVIDVLMPYIYFDEKYIETNCADSIYIFLSNSGSKQIEKIMYDAWLEGIPRESMALTDFSSHLKAAAYNEPGGLQHSKIVDKNLIDAFVPFLPLEKEHVKQCIIKELKLRQLPINKDVTEKIANEFVYVPPEFKLFSVCGCKKVSNKIDLYGQNNT